MAEQLEFEGQTITVLFKIGIDAGGKGVGQDARLIREAPVPAAWPIRAEEGMTRIEPCTLRSVEMQRPAIKSPSTLTGTRCRWGTSRCT